jgi:D-amino-acid dehydrogenase
MKVVILGAGVIGVTTAYVLASRGYEVTVIDRQKESASETSYANGGQLSYSHAEPWANPAVFAKVFKWMFKDDAPLVMRPRADYRMMRWGLSFLRNCSKSLADANTVTMLRLGLYSRKKMDQLVQATGIEFNFSRDGILHIFSNEQGFEQAKRQAAFQENLGCKQDILTVEQCITKEPALQGCADRLAGGIYAHLDESGDVCTFTRELTRICREELKVNFLFETDAKSLIKDGKTIRAVQTSQGDITADRFVVSLGSYSSAFLRPLGMNFPIYPMKGYSVTIPANIHTPKLSLTDQQTKTVYSRLGDRLRVAGTAEFAGYNDDIRAHRINVVLNAVKSLFPSAMPEDESVIENWACLRPSTPDGPPIIGKTPLDNLYMNTGHGTLGWTQAAGSAFLFADYFDGQPTEVSLDGMTVERYL